MIYGIFRFLVKIILFIDLFILSILLFLMAFLPTSIRPIGRLIRWMFMRWAESFRRFLGVDLAVHQHHAKPLPKQFIVISNHPSIFEDIGMPMVFDARFVGKREVRDWFLVGRIAASLGAIFVKREEKSSRKATREAMAQALKDGFNVGIFMEGGCKGRRIYTPFTSGAFDLSLETGIPIIPVLLHYEEQDSFEWMTGNGLSMCIEIMRARNRRANYRVFDPLYPSQFQDRDHYRTHTEALYLQWEEKFLKG